MVGYNLKELKKQHRLWQRQFHVLSVDVRVAEVVTYQAPQHREARLLALREHLASLKACLCAADALIDVLSRRPTEDPLACARWGVEHNNMAWTLMRKEQQLKESASWAMRSSFLHLHPVDFTICVADQRLLDQRAPSATPLVSLPSNRA